MVKQAFGTGTDMKFWSSFLNLLIIVYNYHKIIIFVVLLFCLLFFSGNNHMFVIILLFRYVFVMLFIKIANFVVIVRFELYKRYIKYNYI